MLDPYPLLQYLRAHRLSALHEAAEFLGLSSSEVERMIAVARQRGVRLFSENGYLRLESELSLYDAGAVRSEIQRTSPGRLAELRVLSEVDSTNTYLAEVAKGGLENGVVCLAEYQTAGRGRRGRAWLGAYGASVLVSLHWHFPPQRSLEGLSLSVGVATLKALQSLGARGLALKWPNDVYGSGAKLAGTLVETAGTSDRWHTVTGIGLNVSTVFAAVDQPWIALDSLVDVPLDRDEVAGRLIGHVLNGMVEFATEGFAPAREAWQHLDITRDRPVCIDVAGQLVTGIGIGIDVDGALRVKTPDGVRIFHSGEVSLRLEDPNSVR